jgi:hypothetical protein
LTLARFSGKALSVVGAASKWLANSVVIFQKVHPKFAFTLAGGGQYAALQVKLKKTLKIVKTKRATGSDGSMQLTKRCDETASELAVIW